MASQPQETQTFITPGVHPPNNSAPKPTLLAFHGSGSNATVHTVQLARLMRCLRPYFDVESLEAPFPSAAGPGVLPFFDGCGPFKRWLPPADQLSTEAIRAGESTHTLAPEVEFLVRTTVERVQGKGSRVVGLVGFSQGTRIVSGLIRAAEVYRSSPSLYASLSFTADLAFGLLVCPSYPPPVFPSALPEDLVLDKKITSPMFHVLGLQDEWKWAGESLIEKFFEKGEGRSVVVEWEMGHYYPVNSEESEAIAKWMIRAFRGAEEQKVE
ncbi:citrinin biosynthesis oxidoreductase-like protein CtnB [Phaeosphaeriaceae sp. PMI808]|nr:citrinin biosynthesis oxidoreductase-like protein CtnB [Phaeosphaeriaceae sp. PMI808]